VALGKARMCLTTQGLSVKGGPVLPPQGGNSPDGELTVVNGGVAGFIAFYSDTREAQRLEPEVAKTAQRLGGQIQRHGAITVIWTRRPMASLRHNVETCAFGR
jgi:hypothetical protein